MVFPWTPGPGKSFRGTSSPSFSGKDTDEIATRRAGRDNRIKRKRRASRQSSSSTNVWMPLGPAPLASDASGNGTQDYHQVSGRATAVAIDPSDGTGNTVYIGGAQSGIWKSSNAASSNASDVIWTPLTDDQATLSIGAIAVQPGNTGVILAATGEANNAGDSYFGLGMLRSADFGGDLESYFDGEQRWAVVQRPGWNAHGVQHGQRAGEYGGRGDGNDIGRTC